MPSIDVAYVQDWLQGQGVDVTVDDLVAVMDDEQNASISEMLAVLFLLDYVETGYMAQLKQAEKDPAYTPPKGSSFLGLSAVAIVASAGEKFKPALSLDSASRSAYAKQAFESAQDTPEVEYLIYKTVGDGRVRDAHRAINGTCLPKTHAWWKTHYPPNGFRCRCRAIPATKEQAVQHGIDADIPAEEMIDYENPDTGETVTLPASVSPGWQYGPSDLEEQLQALIDDKMARFKQWKAIKH